MVFLCSFYHQRMNSERKQSKERGGYFTKVKVYTQEGVKASEEIILYNPKLTRAHTHTHTQ